MNKKEKFIKKCINKFGNKFTYTEYIDSKTKIEIKCNEHNEYFHQVPAEHLRGKNACKFCKNPIKEKNNIIKLAKNRCKILGNDKFINKGNIVHNNKYDYSKVTYVDSKTKIKIICPIHGEFEQLPYSHLRGKGCNLCGYDLRSNKLSFDSNKFIVNAKIEHGDKYNYSLVDYIKAKLPIKIICPIHGEFEQIAEYHVNGSGCQICGQIYNKQEIEIKEILTELSIKYIENSRKIIPPLELDIYIPSHNLAIEYNGLYWHSELFKNKKYHLNKTELCEKQGIQLIHIFEDEWLFKREIVKSRLLNILGLTQNKIYGRKTQIKEVSVKDSRKFLNDNHIQGNINSSIKIGLYYEDELVSLMTFGGLRKLMGSKSEEGVYELYRFCNKLNTNIIGGADKLLKYFIKTHQPKQIISYADRRWSQGDLYKKLGFEFIHYSQPSYFYIIGKIRKHRFGFRKHFLKKQGFDIENKTEHEIMLERKIYRIYDCGTITYKLKLC
jgi:hypothetical protein